jgi:RNA polymerase sigma-70 factor (ECF subfamily)
LYGVITRIIADENIAEEVLHDAFLRVWERIDSYDPKKGRLFTWMLNLTRNLAIDKTRSREITRQQKTIRLEKLVHTGDKGGVVLQQDEIIGLRDVLTKLSEDQRFIIEHLYLKGFTQSEVAEEFNIPLGTVKTRTRLAMSALRTIIGLK